MNMAWVAVDKDGTEVICNPEPYRDTVDFMWCIESGFYSGAIQLPKGTIKKLLGRKLTWEDEPVELKREQLCIDKSQYKSKTNDRTE